MRHPDLRLIYPLLEQLADGRFHSGRELGERLGVSRGAIWKRLRSATDLGLQVQAVSGKGYRLARPLELLRAESIATTLNGHSRALLGRLEILPGTDSTNRHLLELGKGGAACLAEYQWAGRGRRGRRWHTPFGAGICLSVSWRFDHSAAALSGLSLAAGVWTAEALRAAGVEGVGLKWPNDLLHEGRKLAGVLIEVQGEADGPCLAVVGVGVNLEMSRLAGQRIGQPWTDLRAVTGRRPRRNHLAGLLLHHVLTGLFRYQREGLEGILERWSELDCLAGRPVRLRHPAGELLGTAQGVDRAGALLLRSAEGVRAIHSGEVSVRLQ
ncbi:MAG TPA: bifunctional biotin--[acetyl-CoA-carboxylase] ligase/biotin operon repressor BirA [Gammaproteobacteria bacterium]|nr:bifunctional biotin--[acetyl-CoA-carboxylase] ligase/biotin operon repressor BirA [Gammaproteobacteria bacterium]